MIIFFLHRVFQPRHYIFNSSNSNFPDDFFKFPQIVDFKDLENKILEVFYWTF